MPILIIQLIVQIYFAVHSAKGGRYFWIFIILFFPLVGSTVYFFVEYLPEMQMNKKIKKERHPAKINPNDKIRQFKRELEINDCLKNRIGLAEGYFEKGAYKEAIDVLRNSLEGIYADDSNLLEGLCYAHFHNGDFSDTKDYLIQLEETQGRRLSQKLRLMKARNFEALGEIDSALHEYESIKHTCSGNEARCRYALLLKKNGEVEKANKEFSEILKNNKLQPAKYKKLYKKWIDIAQAEMRKEKTK